MIGCFEHSKAYQLRTMHIVTRDTSYKLARKARVEVFKIQYDTTAFEFYGSEMYARGIPLTDKNSPWIDANSTLFTKEEMEGFNILANKVNQAGQSGRASFFLRKALA